MTDAPEKIWVMVHSPKIIEGSTFLGTCWATKAHDGQTYIREDVALAMVAAERQHNYKIALDFAQFNAVLDYLSNPPSDDAKAALDKLIAEARREELEREQARITDYLLNQIAEHKALGAKGAYPRLDEVTIAAAMAFAERAKG